MKIKYIIRIVVISSLLAIPGNIISQYSRILIIVPDEFYEEILPLKNFKDCSARKCHVVKLTNIYNNSQYSTGSRDNPEKIKKCIADYKKSYSVNYVLLVGDCDKFPVRYCRAINTQWGTKYYPADLYYADIYKSDGVTFDNWNSGSPNGWLGEIDFKGFGEKNMSKLNIDNLNLYPDIAVGRILASTQAEIKTYVEKVISYEIKAPGNWFEKALWITDEDWGTAAKKDRLDTYMTGFSIIKPYTDPLWGVHAPNHISRDERALRINNHINNGVGFVNYFGHGCRSSWSWVYDQYDTYDDMGSLTNKNMLPIVFAVSCYTGRFHFDQCINSCITEDKYMAVNDIEWTNSNKVATRPEPRAVQPAIYDRESMAEEFTVKRSTGGVAYIGCSSINEFGGEDLDKYFFEAFKIKPKPITLGQMWDHARTQFISNVDLTSFFAYLHLYKVNMFGDPSIVVGGAYAKDISENIDPNTIPNVKKILGYSRSRIDIDITVPTGQLMHIDSSASILFENGKKIIAMDSNIDKGLTVSGCYSYMPVCMISLSKNTQSKYLIHGIKVSEKLKLRNGGEIKLH
ncbi:MAG: C25 family cysteine peptidase [Bacteroidota bacterium]